MKTLFTLLLLIPVMAFAQNASSNISVDDFEEIQEKVEQLEEQVTDLRKGTYEAGKALKPFPWLLIGGQVITAVGALLATTEPAGGIIMILGGSILNLVAVFNVGSAGKDLERSSGIKYDDL